MAFLNQDALVEKVASVNKNTIVVVQSVGPINMEAWVTNANGEYWPSSLGCQLTSHIVTAVVWSGLAGQEAGNSLVDVIYGAYNPRCASAM
jgi:beta-glucosidase